MLQRVCDKCGKVLTSRWSYDMVHYGRLGQRNTNDVQMDFCDDCHKKIVQFIKCEEGDNNNEALGD